MEQIIETVNRYIKAIHTQDKEDFYDIWVNSDDVTLISITRQYTGIDAIYQDFLINGIQAHYSSIDLINEGMEIRTIDDDTAIVIFRYHTECIRRDTGEPHGIAGLETQVMKKVNGQWKLVHVHYSK